MLYLDDGNELVPRVHIDCRHVSLFRFVPATAPRAGGGRSGPFLRIKSFPACVLDAKFVRAQQALHRVPNAGIHRRLGKKGPDTGDQSYRTRGSIVQQQRIDRTSEGEGIKKKTSLSEWECTRNYTDNYELLSL
jgi:hypothetical protein